MNENRREDLAKLNLNEKQPRNRAAFIFNWLVSLALVITSAFIIYRLHAYQSLAGTYSVIAAEDERRMSDSMTLHDNNVVTNFTPGVDWAEGKFHIEGEYLELRLNGVKYKGHYNKQEKTLAVMVDGKIELFKKTAKANGKE
ncbi:hypothetical protein NFX39_01255 [Fructobacillus sp. W13]|uniref:Uncharacterized protein n=1 Tax=Fructobacillus apis TaxID=2935017 RepID=A0ABT0ZP08_9LACO|nr:hypothetical protein [Fructobacillus apis]MCO0831721.1 hypothetical protein [Fructobacillus apis]